MSVGKNFEEDFQKSFKEDHEARILRLYDTTNGYAGVANPCDFVYYAFPKIGFFELKSTQGNRLPLCNITDRQWQGLLDRSKLRGVTAAILIQYRDHKEGYLVPIQLLEYIKYRGEKSIHISDAKAYGMPLNLQYKRTRCGLDPYKFLSDFTKYSSPILVEETHNVED